MTIAKCIEKHRDSNGNIIEYVLEDMKRSLPLNHQYSYIQFHSYRYST